MLIVLECLLVSLGFIKMLFFLRLNTEYSQLVQMVASTFGQVVPFINFFVMWVFFFAILYYNLQIEIDSAESEYLKVFEFGQYWLMTYRDSIGDISIPGYGEWDKIYDDNNNQDRAKKYVIILLIWIVWLLNQFMCLIVLLNFLIAVISQVYDNVVAEQL